MKAVHKTRRLVSIVESMAQAKLSIALTALISLAVCLSGANAQTTIDPRGATHFPGNAYATRSQVSDGSPISTNAMSCSYWYASTTPSTAVIFQVLPFPGDLASVILRHQRYSNGSVLLNLQLNNDTGMQYLFAEESTPLPYDGKPHGVFFAVDTNHGFTMVSLDGVPLSLDSTSGFTSSFKFLWNGSTWTVGAALLGTNRIPGLYFTGDIGRIFCIAGDSLYDINANPLTHFKTGELRSTTIGQTKLTIGRTVITHVGPLPLSTPADPDCTAPYNPSSVGKPSICLQGGMPDFLVNINNNPFVAVGNLTTAPVTSDPWSVWPSSYP